MSLDLFFRAKNTATYIKWLTRADVRSIIGDIRARDENGNLIFPAALQDITDSVILKEWAVNKIIEVPDVLDNDGNLITPAVRDPQAWIQVRLTGLAEIADFTGLPIDTEVDRWEHSKLVNLVKTAGNPNVYRGVSNSKVTTGPNKGISVFRGYELETTIKFHEFSGGNYY